MGSGEEEGQAPPTKGHPLALTLFARSTLALFSMSESTTVKWPFSEASISAVSPSCRAPKVNTTEGFEGQQHERGHDPSPLNLNPNLTPNRPPLSLSPPPQFSLNPRH